MFLGRGSHNTLRISRGPQKRGGTDLLNSGCVARGPQRGCNLVRLACNPGVIFVILILILLLQIRKLQ